jgi:hypothetical protein
MRELLDLPHKVVKARYESVLVEVHNSLVHNYGIVMSAPCGSEL